MKSRKKRIFVFVLLYALLFTGVVYLFIGSGVYVIFITLLSCLLFEIASIFMYGLFSKKMPVMKLVLLLVLFILDYIHQLYSSVHIIHNNIEQTRLCLFFYVEFNFCRMLVIWFSQPQIIHIILMDAQNTPPFLF